MKFINTTKAICGSALFFSLLSCQEQKQTDHLIIDLSRDSFPEKYTLSNPDTIQITEALNPNFYYLIRDSLVLISNADDAQDYKCGLYSLTGKLLTELAPKGSGPTEFVSVSILPPSLDSNLFQIEDVVQHKLWTFNLDSLLKYKTTYKAESMTLPSGIVNYCFLNPDTLIGYNFGHIDDKNYTNHTQALDFYPLHEYKTNKLKQKYDYFVANVTGGLLFTTNQNNNIWCADLNKDEIDLYDDSLKIKKRLVGPDHYKMQYAEVPEGESRTLIFKRSQYFEAYRCFTVTNKHVYLLYSGINNVRYDPENLPAVEVLKFDYDGNPLAIYKLDRYMYTISVDSDENYLYGTACKSYMDQPDFVRYSLN